MGSAMTKKGFRNSKLFCIASLGKKSFPARRAVFSRARDSAGMCQKELTMKNNGKANARVCVLATFFLAGCLGRPPVMTTTDADESESEEAAVRSKPASNGKTEKTAASSPAPTNFVPSSSPTTGAVMPSSPSPATSTPLPDPTPDTRTGTPSISMLITPNASQGIYDMDVSLISGMYHPALRMIREGRNVETYGEWKQDTKVHPQHFLEWGGEVYMLGTFNIPGYSENNEKDAGVAFRWDSMNKAWEFLPGPTGLYIKKSWYRSQQVEQIRQDFLVPLTDGRGWKFSLADGNVPGKVTLNTPKGTLTADISSLENQLPACSSLYDCEAGSISRMSGDERDSFFRGKILESARGLCLVNAKKEQGQGARMADGSWFQPEWLTVSVWTQNNGQTEWTKLTNFRADSGNTVFIERIPGSTSSPFGDKDAIIIFGDIQPLVITE